MSPSCDYARALTVLNAAIVTAIEAVTGGKAPWMQTPRFDQHPGYKATILIVMHGSTHCLKHWRPNRTK
jgi:hypothetical protein